MVKFFHVVSSYLLHLLQLFLQPLVRLYSVLMLLFTMNVADLNESLSLLLMSQVLVPVLYACFAFWQLHSFSPDHLPSLCNDSAALFQPE